MENLLSGLIGAVLGGSIAGIGTYIGAKKTTQSNIDIQKELFENEQKIRLDEKLSKTRKYSELILIEILSWIEYCILRINIVYSSNHASKHQDYNKDYRIYMDSFIGKMEYEDINNIIKIYGMIKKVTLNLETLGYQYGDPIEITLASEILVKELFGEDTYEYYVKLDPTIITQDSMVGKLKIEYLNLLRNLKEISSSDIFLG